MLKQLMVLKTGQNLSAFEAARVKDQLRNALARGGPIVLGGGMTLETVTLDTDALLCEYCGNPIDRCNCGAARVKVEIETMSGRIPTWELDGLAKD